MQIEGNVTLGQPSGSSAGQGGTGTLTFATGWTGATFNVFSDSNNVSRTVTTLAPIIVNHPIVEAGGGTNLGLTKAGASSLTLTGQNTYTGLTTVSAGTMTLNGGSLATSEISITGGTLAGDSTNKETINFLVAGDTIDTINVASGLLNITNLILALNLSGTQTQNEYVLVNQPVGSTLIGGTNFLNVTGPPRSRPSTTTGRRATPIRSCWSFPNRRRWVSWVWAAFCCSAGAGLDQRICRLNCLLYTSDAADE